MDKQVILSIIAVAGTLVGTLGASLIGFIAQRESKRLANLEKKVKTYEKEIAARMYLEKIAMRCICEGKMCVSEPSAQIMLRDKTQLACGYRPTMIPSDVEVRILDQDIELAFAPRA
jgi:hypothetical protein